MLVHIYMHAYTFIHVIHKHVLSIYTYTYVYMYKYIYTNIHIYVYIYICIYINTYIHMCIFISFYTRADRPASKAIREFVSSTEMGRVAADLMGIDSVMLYQTGQNPQKFALCSYTLEKWLHSWLLKMCSGLLQECWRWRDCVAQVGNLKSQLATKFYYAYRKWNFLYIQIYYRVATISRLLEIIGLFCKRAL